MAAASLIADAGRRLSSRAADTTPVYLLAISSAVGDERGQADGREAIHDRGVSAKKRRFVNDFRRDVGQRRGWAPAAL